MPDTDHPLHSSIVRICDENGTIHGAGFLAESYLVCTCVHVVADALHISRETEQKPEGEVRLDFPFLGESEVSARIHVWVPIDPNDDGGDIAVLRLMTDPPASARPARLLPMSNLLDRNFDAYGFPSTTDVGQYAYGILRDRLANGYVQLEGTATTGYRVQQGYSGTPVWDQRRGGVVGMVVAADRDSVAKVAFMIPNDLIHHACPDIKPITLHQMFAPLTDGLMSNHLSGVEQFLRTYLGTPTAPTPFGGRKGQLDELDRWLAAPEQPYALLVAEAGRGKSALLAQWVAKVASEPRADVVLVPISIRFGTSVKSTTMNLLGTRLRHLHSVKADLPLDAEGWLAEIDLYLREDRPDGPPLLIVLDGADEAADWMMGQDLRFPPEPGRGIKVLVSARSLADCDTAGWLRRLEWQEVAAPIELPLLDRTGLAEVLRSMGDPLARLATQVDVMGELYRLSEGDPLLVRLYVDALRGSGERAAFLAPEYLGHLKPGLQTYFDQWWDDQRRHWGTAVPLKEPAVRTLLNLLACALGPLSSDDLLALTELEGFDLWTLEEALGPLARFVVGDGKVQGYVFSHPRLSQYFYEKLPSRERQSWEHRFVSYGEQMLSALRGGEQDPRKVSLYAVRYYGAHLERVGADLARFNELVSESWLRAWEALDGTYDGFLSDLARAWKRADASCTQAQSVQERGRAIGRQCRYALIAASIKSLAGNIPPTLLTALVAKGVWTPIQGLAYARQIPDEEQRIQALVGLAPYLPLLQEILPMIQAFVNKRFNREEILVGLLVRLGEIGRDEEALELARTIENKKSRARALAELASHFPTDDPQQKAVRQEALAVVCEFRRMDDEVEALAALVPYLPKPLVQEAVVGLVPRLKNEASAIVDLINLETYEANALEVLAPHLPASLLQEVLSELRFEFRHDESARVKVLAWLAPYLPKSLLLAALQLAREIRDGSARAEALACLAPYLPVPRLEAMLQEELKRTRAFALPPAASEPISVEMVQEELAMLQEELKLAQAFTMPPVASELVSVEMIQEEPELARKMESELSELDRKLSELDREMEAEFAIRKAQGLLALAPHLPKPLQEAVLQGVLVTVQVPANTSDREKVGLVRYLGELGQEEQALALAQAITDESHLTKALIALVPHLPEALLSEALAVAQAIRDESNRTKVLVELAPHLPEALLQEALEQIRSITGEPDRTKALAALAPYLPESLLPEALAVAQSIVSRFDEALAALAPYLPESLLLEALAVAQSIVDAHSRSKALAGIAPHLPGHLLKEALMTVQAIGDARNQTKLLAELVHWLGELGSGEEALEVSRAIVDTHSRAQALLKLTAHVPESLQEMVLQEALTAARAIVDAHSGAQALVKVAAHLPESLQEMVLQEALTAARAIVDAHSRAQALLKLTAHVPESLQEMVLQEALITVQSIVDARSRAQALVELIPHLPASLLADVWEVGKAIPNEFVQAKGLVEFVGRLGELGFPEAALGLIRVNTRVSNWTETLVGLAPYLPEPMLLDALEMAQKIEDEHRRTMALIGLLAYLPESLQETVVQEALAAARAIEDVMIRVSWLAKLAPYLSETLRTAVLQEALAASQQIESNDVRGYLLECLAPSLSEPLLQEALAMVQAIKDEEDRAMALKRLVPHLSVSLLQEVLTVARSVVDSYYRGDALVGFVRRLGELRSGEEALKVAQTITRDHFQAQALVELAAYLSESLLPKALETAQAIQNENGRAAALAGLIAHLPEQLLATVLQKELVAARTIQNSNSRAEVLAKLATHMKQLPVVVWSETLKVMATRSRGNLLSDIQALAAAIAELGGKEALVAVAQAIIEVGKWFP